MLIQNKKVINSKDKIPMTNHSLATRLISFSLIATIILAGCQTPFVRTPPPPNVLKAAEDRMLTYASDLGYEPASELLKGCDELPGRYACVVAFKTKLDAAEFASRVANIKIPKLTQLGQSGPKVTKGLLSQDFTKQYRQWQHVPNTPFLAADEWVVGAPNPSPFTSVGIDFIELTLVPNSYTWNGSPITDNVVRIGVDFDPTISACRLLDNCPTTQAITPTTAVK